MNKVNLSRRGALRLLIVGSAVSVATGCEVLDKLPNRQAGGSTDGSDLALEVRKALKAHSTTQHFILDISSKEDEVIIKGFVPSDADIRNIESVVYKIKSVRHAFVDVHLIGR